VTNQHLLRAMNESFYDVKESPAENLSRSQRGSSSTCAHDRARAYNNRNTFMGFHEKFSCLKSHAGEASGSFREANERSQRDEEEECA
jgi:hypothetical protein